MSPYIYRGKMKKRSIIPLAVVMIAALLGSAVHSEGEKPLWYTSPAASGVYIISSADEFEEFAELVTAGEDFNGRTVYLTESVTLTTVSCTGGVFMGTFDGLGNTVTLSKNSKTSLFGKLEGAQIRNLGVTSGDAVTLLQDEMCGVIVNEAINCTFDGVAVGGRFDFAYADESNTDYTLISGMIAGLAENSAFLNCVVTAESDCRAGLLAGEASVCDVENSYLANADIFMESQECEFSSTVVESSVSRAGETDTGDGEIPVDGEPTGDTSEPTETSDSYEAPGIIFLDKTDEDLQDIAQTLNLAAGKNENYNLWTAADGALKLHVHKGEKSATEASCTEHGQITYTCECGATLLTCQTPLAEHTLVAGDVVEPTCTEQGYTVYRCIVCEVYEQNGDFVEALGHKTEVRGAYPATCAAKGFSGDQVCTVCETVVKKGSSIKATGNHNWAGTITKQPTADEQGIMTLTCSVCGKKQTETLPKLGHTMSDYEDYDETRHRATCSCGNDEDTVYAEHSWDEGRVVRNPGCVENGAIEYECTVCRRKKEITVPMLGHSYGEWTAADDDTHTRKCPTCSEVKSEAHAFVEDSVVSQTEEDGMVVKRVLFKCGVCGAQTVREDRSPIGYTNDPGEHNGGNGEIAGTDSNIKYIIIGVIALLLIGGVGATVYIKRSDRV